MESGCETSHDGQIGRDYLEMAKRGSIFRWDLGFRIEAHRQCSRMERRSGAMPWLLTDGTFPIGVEILCSVELVLDEMYSDHEIKRR